MSMEYELRGADIFLRQPDFDLEQTLDCGQAFRWSKNGDGFTGFRLDKPLRISAHEDGFILENTTESDFLSVWADYFDLRTDYRALKQRLSSADKTLRSACTFAGGIRLLRQDGWEALCSFIISQNNNIPRIKGIIARMCEVFGGFPTPQQLASAPSEALAPLRAGFRERYLRSAAQLVAGGMIDFNILKNAPLDEAKRELMKITGVGEKVAMCTLLYGFYRTEAFPVDVWIHRVLDEYYPDGFPAELYDVRGIAQQYLFHYIRCCGAKERYYGE